MQKIVMYKIVKVEELPEEIKKQEINAESFLVILGWFIEKFPDHEYVDTIFLPSKPSFFNRAPKGAFFILKRKS